MLTFYNSSSKPVQIAWISHDGSQMVYGNVAPGGKHPQGTYATHPWVIRDEMGHVHALAVAQDGQASNFYIVDGDDGELVI